MSKLRHFAVQIIDKWWIVYGISLIWFMLWCAFVLLGPKKPIPNDETIFYPWISPVSNVVFSIPLVGFLVGWLLFTFKKRSIGVSFTLGIATLVCVFAVLWWIGPIVGPIQNGFEPDPTLTPIDNVRANNHVYNLVTHSAFYEALGRAYILYECDRLDIICHVVYRYKPKSLDAAYADLDHAPFLSLDEHSLMVHIAGVIAYTHPI